MPPLAMGGMLVSPIRIAPASRSRSITNASCLGYQVGERRTSRGRREPACEITVLGGKGNSVQRATRLAARPALRRMPRRRHGPAGSAQRRSSIECRRGHRRRSAPGSFRADQPRLPGPSRARAAASAMDASTTSNGELTGTASERREFLQAGRQRDRHACFDSGARRQCARWRRRVRRHAPC